MKKYSNRTAFISCIFLIHIFAPIALANPDWDKANENIHRIHIDKYTMLPRDNIFKEMGCAVPQLGLVSDSGDYPQVKQASTSVIQGEFARKGQKDWAILCSRNQESSIVIMWGGDSRCPSEIESTADSTYLQGYGGNRILYSRYIELITSKEINQRSETRYDPPPPAVDHDGIHDIYESKASTILYCQNGEWQYLGGAD